MKLWIDDVRPAPNGYTWCKSVNETINAIINYEGVWDEVSRFRIFTEEDFDLYSPICLIELIDIDHDAGDYAKDGGDYIKLLDWLEETGRNYPIHIHSMNPVGIQNMRAIIRRNGWIEV